LIVNLQPPLLRILVIFLLLLLLEGKLLAKYLSSSQPGQINERDPDWPVDEYLTWPEANQLCPLWSEVKIMDVDTGLSFRIKRRAGSYQADR